MFVLRQPDERLTVRMYSTGEADPITGGCRLLFDAPFTGPSGRRRNVRSRFSTRTRRFAGEHKSCDRRSSGRGSRSMPVVVTGC